MTTETNTNRQPEYRLFQVVGQGKNARWTDMGAAWPHKDGQGYSISLNAVPLTGRLVMRAIGDSTEEIGGQP